ncbi:MAG: hypothetical protein WCF18_13265 [Chthoniobacteraceae bacterium]
MIWRLIRNAPKYSVAALLFVVPAALLAFWWFTRTPPARPGVPIPTPAPVDVSDEVAKVKLNHGRLVLADNDLYDSETGKLIFTGWLKEGMPVKLFWEKETATVLAQYELGFVRYAPDGSVKTKLLREFAFGVADDYRWITFPKEKDVWVADVDWPTLALKNERQLTTLGQFNERYYAANIILGTDKTLIVRNLNQLLRIDIQAASVHPTRIPLNEIAKRVSPDSKSVVGLQNGKFYCYDVDTDALKEIPVGRGAMNDYQWLDNDRCAMIAAGKSVVIYDQKKHALDEVCALPGFFNRIGEPSPNGRYVFCAGQSRGVLVDLQQKTAKPVTGGAGVSWVGMESFIFSREVQDSELRGTWIQKPGEEEKRISPVPFIVPRKGSSILKLTGTSAGLVMTKSGLARIDAGAGEFAEKVHLLAAPGSALAFEEPPAK